jgi:hypothetical protein
MIPTQLFTEATDLKKKIADGKIKPPADEKTYNQFVKTLK